MARQPSAGDDALNASVGSRTHGTRGTADDDLGIKEGGTAVSPLLGDDGHTGAAAVTATATTLRRRSKRAATWLEKCVRWIVELRASLHGRKLFTLLAVVNLFNYLDRGVIPGGSEEFNDFIQQTLDTDRPDLFLGILQSGFILGFSMACVAFATLTRHLSPFSLMGAGLGMWCGASVLAGLAKPLGSYTVLLVARLLSGVGEASFVTVVPPLITETAPQGERGLWLALFYTAQPMGAGLGYVYGSSLATSVGWQWAFYLEALCMAPLAFACALVPRERAVAVATLPSLSPLSGGVGGDGDNSISQTSRLIGDPKEHERRIAALYAEGSGGGDADSPALGSPISMTSPATNTLAEGRPGSGLGQADRRRSSRSSRSSGGDASTGEDGEEERAGLLSSFVEFLPGGEEEEEEKEERAMAGVRVEDGVDTEVPMDWQRHAPDTDSEGEGGRNAAVSPSRIVGVAGGEEWGVGGRPSVASSFGSLNSSRDRDSPFPGLSEASPNASAVVDRSVVKDVIEVASRPVFCLVVLGSAATAAVTAGMSTFGTGFVTSLEFLTSERAAAAAFGAVICAAGLAGTPAGGALIDAADPDGRLDDEKKLAMILTQATTLMCGSTVLLVGATAQPSLIPFLFLFFFGGALLFATSAHSNLAVMLASPKHLRPLAIAVNSIVLHALGDVPSPTVIGWMKDTLAPHCAAGGGPPEASVAVGRTWTWWAVGSSASAVGTVGLEVDEGWGTGTSMGLGLGAGRDYGAAVGRGLLGGISDACRAEKHGLHLALLVIALWLLWTCLFFGLARSVQESALEHGVLRASWGDIRGLISKGLFRPDWANQGGRRGRGRYTSRRPSDLAIREGGVHRYGRGEAVGRGGDFGGDRAPSSLERALLASPPQTPQTPISFFAGD